MKKNLLSAAIFAAIAVPTMPAFAQEDAAIVEEVIVTGSAIQRADLEASIPVQVISQEDIQRSGVTSVADLMNKIPAMQGMVTASDSVGGGGGGIRTASLRAIGPESEKYTLVLLNGRRLAASDSGGAIDLSHIPLGAIERVEILTDGASALYGSDAIAGVVNFILKKDLETTTINARFDKPRGGGEASSFGITSGFGDLDSDGFNVMLSFSHNEQDALAAKERDFGKTGIIRFLHPEIGQQVEFFNGSTNAIPGNARVTFTDDRPAKTFNPYQAANGSCAPDNAPVGTQCSFDYTSTLEVIPDSAVDTLFVSGKFNISENLTGFAEALYSQREMTTRIAPYPTGSIPIDVDSELVAEYVTPYLTADEIANMDRVFGTWRALPAGNRTTEWVSNALHLVAGLEGSAGDITYSGSVFHSVTDQDQNYPTGWLLADEFVNLVASGQVNIFDVPGNLTDADAETLAPAIYHGNWDNTKVAVTGFDAKAQMPLFAMAGGDAQLATGAEYRLTTYDRTLSEANQNQSILFLSADTPYGLERDQFGIFAEALFPIIDNAELTASVRFDQFSGVDSDALGTVGDSESAVTYKVTGKWDLNEFVTARASYGTGFKAATMREIAAPREDFGVTSGSFDCPFPAGHPDASLCLVQKGFQSQVFLEGNGELKPETSTQYSAGFVFRPTDGINITVDYWDLDMEDIVTTLTEQQVFDAIAADPDGNSNLYSAWLNPVTGENELAIIQRSVNSAWHKASGIDYRMEQILDMSFGEISWNFGGTYMLNNENSVTGSSIGKFGADDTVVFRNVIRSGVSLSHGSFTHSLDASFRSGYTDQAQSVALLEADGSYTLDADGEIQEVGVQLEVPRYTTVNFTSQYLTLNDKLALTLGINNLTDKQPPRTLRTSGAGHQIGFDPRYSDPYGRTLYLQAGYSF